MIHPEAEEVCEDGVDQDCTGQDAACGPTGDHDVTDADMVLVGDYAEMFLGASLFAGGDTNGDGRDELWVGSVGWDEPEETAGAVFRYDEITEGTWSPETTAGFFMRGEVETG